MTTDTDCTIKDHVSRDRNCEICQWEGQWSEMANHSDHISTTEYLSTYGRRREVWQGMTLDEIRTFIASGFLSFVPAEVRKLLDQSPI